MTTLILAIALILSGSLIINYKKERLWIGIIMTVLGTALIPIWNQTVASERAENANKKERLLELITLVKFDLKPIKNDFYRPMNLIPELEKNLNNDTTIYTKLMLDKLKEEKNTFERRYNSMFSKVDFLNGIINDKKIKQETDTLYAAYEHFYIEIFNNSNNSDIKFNSFETFRTKHEEVLDRLQKEYTDF